MRRAGTFTAKSSSAFSQSRLNSIDRIVYLDIVKDGVVVDGTSGYMKFDGTTFTITDLDKDTFGADEFHYVITDKEFSPD